MVKKRNHYVPQYLLRRFASRQNGSRHWVWQFRTGAEPVEVSTKNVAVSTYFYGQPETGVEGALADLEGKQVALLRHLDAGGDPAGCAEQLRELVWSLSFRTRALRSQFAKTAGRVVDELGAVDDEAIAGAFRRNIANNFEHLLDEALSKLPLEQQASIRQKLEAPGALDAAKERVLGDAASSVSIVGPLLEQLAGLLPGAADSGHVKGLAKLLAKSQAVPDEFAVPHWSIEQCDANSLVVGDGIVFAVGPEGAWGALGKFTNSFSEVYTPIAHDRVLVGRRERGSPSLCLEELNAASVQLSLDSFFASRKTETECRLATGIGTGEPLISDEDLRRMASDSWSSLGEPRSGEQGRAA